MPLPLAMHFTPIDSSHDPSNDMPMKFPPTSPQTECRRAGRPIAAGLPAPPASCGGPWGSVASARLPVRPRQPPCAMWLGGRQPSPIWLESARSDGSARWPRLASASSLLWSPRAGHRRRRSRASLPGASASWRASSLFSGARGRVRAGPPSAGDWPRRATGG